MGRTVFTWMGKAPDSVVFSVGRCNVPEEEEGCVDVIMERTLRCRKSCSLRGVGFPFSWLACNNPGLVVFQFIWSRDRTLQCSWDENLVVICRSIGDMIFCVARVYTSCSSG